MRESTPSSTRTKARAKLVVDLVSGLDAAGLAQTGAAWFARLDQLAKVDPAGSGKLAAAMFAHLANYRPEAPDPLDHDFAPTERASDPRTTP